MATRPDNDQPNSEPVGVEPIQWPVLAGGIWLGLTLLVAGLVFAFDSSPTVTATATRTFLTGLGVLAVYYAVLSAVVLWKRHRHTA